MAFGIDFANSGENVAALQTAGVTFACRYLSGGQSKDLTAAERDRLLGAGIGIALVWETDGRTGPLSGTSGGHADAGAAIRQAQALGAPAGTCLYFAVDFDASLTQIAGPIRAYAAAAAADCRAAGYRCGMYGGFATVEGTAGIVDLGWQTYAWSGGRWSTHSAIQQYQNGVVVGGTSADDDRSMTADFGQWGSDMGMSSDQAFGLAFCMWMCGLGREADVATLQADAAAIVGNQTTPTLWGLTGSAEGKAYGGNGSLAQRLANLESSLTKTEAALATAQAALTSTETALARAQTDIAALKGGTSGATATHIHAAPAVTTGPPQ